MSNRCAFVTFVYPGFQDYISSFIDSLNNQSDLEFDLVVHNDGVDDIYKYFDSCRFPVQIISSKLTSLFEIRFWTFNYCSNNGYTHLILGDSDDRFELNRVKVNKDLLLEYDIVVNDVSIIDTNNFVYETRVFSRRLFHNSAITFDSIRDFNFMGFTNTAFSTDILKSFEDCTTKSKVVDWFFFSILLLKGKTAIFSTDTVSYYRQHKENIAGLRLFSESLDNKSLAFFNEVRRMHYESLLILQSEIQNQNNLINRQSMKFKFWWEI
jgi:hypothetical protein